MANMEIIVTMRLDKQVIEMYEKKIKRLRNNTLLLIPPATVGTYMITKWIVGLING